MNDHFAHKWLGYFPVLDQEHAKDLDRKAAIFEFHNKFPRHIAEQAAHDEYMEDQHADAAGHHLDGIKMAQAAGDMKAAKQHGVMYNLHMKALGHDPYEAPPPHIAQRHKEKPSIGYRFRAHKGDAFALEHSKKPPEDIKKSESYCHYVARSTGEKCKNIPSDKIGKRHYCSVHSKVKQGD